MASPGSSFSFRPPSTSTPSSGSSKRSNPFSTASSSKGTSSEDISHVTLNFTPPSTTSYDPMRTTSTFSSPLSSGLGSSSSNSEQLLGGLDSSSPDQLRGKVIQNVTFKLPDTPEPGSFKRIRQDTPIPLPWRGSRLNVQQDTRIRLSQLRHLPLTPSVLPVTTTATTTTATTNTTSPTSSTPSTPASTPSTGFQPFEPQQEMAVSSEIDDSNGSVIIDMLYYQYYFCSISQY